MSMSYEDKAPKARRKQHYRQKKRQCQRDVYILFPILQETKTTSRAYSHQRASYCSEHKVQSGRQLHGMCDQMVDHHNGFRHIPGTPRRNQSNFRHSGAYNYYNPNKSTRSRRTI
ncbi:hypothetical protein JYU34_002009 [Plutella xylostella]|uniref:Uncharacterized protein n=1 Tax=Plutella xylostella TaxID=51655 RepID=A0ABQ7R5C1_PLUXY|nr:hypothetical protein JYU34_002009 [Plutella xylostella]